MQFVRFVGHKSLFFCLDLHVYLALHKANIPLSGLNNIVLATFQKEDIQFDYFK